MLCMCYFSEFSLIAYSTCLSAITLCHSYTSAFLNRDKFHAWLVYYKTRADIWTKNKQTEFDSNVHISNY